LSTFVALLPRVLMAQPANQDDGVRVGDMWISGTFDTFKIDLPARELNTTDPSKISETEVITWFAPLINHWVRRTVVMRFQIRTRTSNSEELTDFSRDF
jgi:hypothetical protein